MSPVEAVAARVLAEHELVGKSVPAGNHECRIVPHGGQSGCGCTRIIVGCLGCDWTANADEHRADAHRAHVAAEIAAALRADEGLVEAAERGVVAIESTEPDPSVAQYARAALDAITTITGSDDA